MLLLHIINQKGCVMVKVYRTIANHYIAAMWAGFHLSNECYRNFLLVNCTITSEFFGNTVVSFAFTFVTQKRIKENSLFILQIGRTDSGAYREWVLGVRTPTRKCTNIHVPPYEKRISKSCHFFDQGRI